MNSSITFENRHFSQNRPNQNFENNRRKVRDKGYTHFAVTVKNLDEIHKLMSDSRIKFVNNPRISDDGGAKVAFCFDPEDNLIEIVEVQ